MEWSSKVSLSLQRSHGMVQQGEFFSAKVSSNGPVQQGEFVSAKVSSNSPAR